jgi:hypothetical protein
LECAINWGGCAPLPKPAGSGLGKIMVIPEIAVAYMLQYKFLCLTVFSLKSISIATAGYIQRHIRVMTNVGTGLCHDGLGNFEGFLILTTPKVPCNQMQCTAQKQALESDCRHHLNLVPNRRCSGVFVLGSRARKERSGARVQPPYSSSQHKRSL